MSDLIAQYAQLDANDIDWLHLLVGDWQVLADLAFADLVLWLPLPDGEFVALAQCRPTTGGTVHLDDVVGTRAPAAQHQQLAAAYAKGRIQTSREPRWIGNDAVREEAVPVVHRGHPIAVVARQTNLGSGRTPSRMELTFVESADDIFAMLARGEYPIRGGATGQRRGNPRVGDGLLRLNAKGEVLYASPNALSCFHRLGLIGSLVGRSLVAVVNESVEYTTAMDDATPLVLKGRAPWRVDIETAKAAVSIRAIPLSEHGQRIGAVLLCRDVSELRLRERDLMTKDATIREIHHRVKNNLATVAALLRLQARRVEAPEARVALMEATRRVATISLVHEFLSQTLEEQVDLDDMLGRALRMTAEVSATGAAVNTVQHGSFGLIPAESATALALVLTELVTNAVEHAFVDGREHGTVWIDVARDGDQLRIYVADDGIGMGVWDGEHHAEEGSGLGTQIVSTLVANELDGAIDWRPRPGGGTDVFITARLR